MSSGRACINFLAIRGAAPEGISSPHPLDSIYSSLIFVTKPRRAWLAGSTRPESVPFFVLSVKARGAGINPTAASHVIHFDRWRNPAVENRAAD
jgi:hypothetical protein